MAEAKTATEASQSKPYTHDDVDKEIIKLRQDVEKLTALLRDITSNAAGIAKETFQQRMGQASDNVHAAMDTTTTTVRNAVHERPLTTVLIALGFGFLLGQILRR